MNDMKKTFPFAYTPEFNSNEYFQDIAMFENYESKTEALPVDDIESMRSVLREIPLDDFKPSQGNKTLLEATQCSVKDSLLTEDEMLALIQRLRRDDSGSGKSNIEYICDYKVKDKSPYFNMNKSFREQLMEEKLREEKEFHESIKEDNLNVKNNRFLSEIDELK